MYGNGDIEMKLSKRDKFLMDEAFKCGYSHTYTDVESWLGDTIDDVGHTAEQYIAFDANNVTDEDKSS
jgi:hypothetical protein